MKCNLMTLYFNESTSIVMENKEFSFVAMFTNKIDMSYG